jgi:hypothetical protein
MTEKKQHEEAAIKKEREDLERAGADAKRDEMFKKQQERERLAEEKIAAAKSTSGVASGNWSSRVAAPAAMPSRPTTDGAPAVWKPTGKSSWRERGQAAPTPFHTSGIASRPESTIGSSVPNSGTSTQNKRENPFGNASAGRPESTIGSSVPNSVTSTQNKRENPFGVASARESVQNSNPPASTPPSEGPKKYVPPNRIKKDGDGFQKVGK